MSADLLDISKVDLIKGKEFHDPIPLKFWFSRYDEFSDFTSGSLDGLSSVVLDVPDISVHKTTDSNKINTMCVLQAEFSITDSTKPKFLIGTFGASTCIIVSGYDSINKIGFVMHIDEMSDIDMNQMLECQLEKMYPDISKFGFDVVILGGDSTTSKLFIDIIFLSFSFSKNEKFTFKITGKQIFGSSSVLLDTMTGNLYKYTNLTLSDSEKERLDKYSHKVMEIARTTCSGIKKPKSSIKYVPVEYSKSIADID
jgi:hypothetical protein